MKKDCKNCIHDEVCPIWDDYNDEPYEDGHRGFCCNYDKFKNKSKYIELPCRIGEELFLIDYPMYHHRLKEYKFIGERVVMIIECFELQRTCKRFVDEHFGVTVFTDKSKAEVKLKELNKNE